MTSSAASAGSVDVNYLVHWYGYREMWLDFVRLHDDDVAFGYNLHTGEYSGHLSAELRAYYEDYDDYGPPWRLAVDDEPDWAERDETIGYVNSFLESPAQGVDGAPGTVPLTRNVYRDNTEWLHHYIEKAGPTEIMIDPYPFRTTMPDTGAAGYPSALHDTLTLLAGDLSRTKAIADSADLPLWVVVQAHDWGNLRPPRPEEIRVQVSMALAHGATGIYYFHMADDTSGVAGCQDAGMEALVDFDYKHDYEPYLSKWNTVQSVNGTLAALSDTLLHLTWTDAFPSVYDSIPAGSVVDSISSDSMHVGTFTHSVSGDSSYLMLVNRRCRTRAADTLQVTVRLDASELKGSQYAYGVVDHAAGDTLYTLAGAHPQFTTSLNPGAFKLFSIDSVSVPYEHAYDVGSGWQMLSLPGIPPGG